MRTIALSVLFVLAASLFAGCARRASTLYEWGSYEDQIYSMYSDTGSAPPDVRIQEFERDLAYAGSQSRSVPPGFYAQLGYLYYQTDNVDEARRSFETEKKLFPESARYMDFLISRLTHT